MKLRRQKFLSPTFKECRPFSDRLCLGASFSCGSKTKKKFYGKSSSDHSLVSGPLIEIPLCWVLLKKV